MAERSSGKLWAMRGAYLGFALAILFAHLLPLETTPRRLAGPDLLTAMTFAWALRRPQYVPPALVAAVMLLADLLLQRPPGLWALLVMLGSEWLRSQDRRLRDNTFFTEWLTIAGTLLLLMAIYRATLSLLIVPSGPLSLFSMQYGMTVMAYPFVAGLTYLAFGSRRKRGALDGSGRMT